MHTTNTYDTCPCKHMSASKVSSTILCTIIRFQPTRNWIKVSALCGALAAWLVMAQAAAETRAILIGVSKFDHLKIAPLDGPLNDVALMDIALRARGLPGHQIIKLTDYAAESYKPRRANILRVFAETAKASLTNDSVIVYFSGHGAQVPQPKPVPKGRWVEPDGLDEVFLTRDTKLWDKKNQRVEGALLDDEIGDALEAFTKKGVHVWAIFDSCHAGDMVRGSTMTDGAPILRGVDATALGVSAAALRAATHRVASQRSSRSGTMRRLAPPQALPSKSQNGKLIAFYATQPDEAAPEEMFPYPDSFADLRSPSVNGRFGIFTWELARAIGQSHHSYAELAKAITTRYESRPFPTPQFEGDLAGSLLLDSRQFPQRP